MPDIPRHGQVEAGDVMWTVNAEVTPDGRVRVWAPRWPQVGEVTAHSYAAAATRLRWRLKAHMWEHGVGDYRVP